MNYPHIAARIFRQPLAISADRLEVILAGVGPRLGLTVNAGVLEMPTPAPAMAQHIQVRGRGGGGRGGQRQVGIAVIPIVNTLVHRNAMVPMSGQMTSYQDLDSQLLMALSDPDVDGILLDIDSPGGEVSGLFPLADQVRKASEIKPVWAVANENAFSAAATIASAAGRVYVPATGVMGSLGVIAAHIDETAKDEKEGRKYTLVHAGERKADLSSHAPLSKEGEAMLQSAVDATHQILLDKVSGWRPGLDVKRVRDASLHWGGDAVKVGLADRLGGLDDAVRDMAMEVQMTGENRPPAAADGGQVPNPSAGEPAPAPPSQDNVVELEAARREGAQRAAEIVELCTLAGFSDRAGQYIASDKAIATIRTELLEAKADRSDEPGEIDTMRPAPAGGSGLPGRASNYGWNDALTRRYGPEVLSKAPPRR